MTNISSVSLDQNYGGNLQNHIIDFDYELHRDEITYLSNNLTDILSKIYSEKRKMGSGVVNNDFIYKFIECGSYLYDIPRSSINIKLERKHSTVTVYVNDIIVDEIITNDDKTIVSKIINYGNIQSGNKTISAYKLKNIVSKKSGLWC